MRLLSALAAFTTFTLALSLPKGPASAQQIGGLPLVPSGAASSVPLSGVTGLGAGVWTVLGLPVGVAGPLSFSVDAFGANGDYQTWGDGSVTSGSATLTSNNATFSRADIGKHIWVFYAGTPTTIAAPAQPTVFTPSSSASVAMADGTVSCYPRGSLGAANYYYRITYIGSGGETLGSTENGVALACGANTVLEATTPAPTYGAIAYNVYASTSAGTETLQNDYPLKIGQTWRMPTTGLRTGGASVPGSNTTSITPPLDTTIAGFVDAHHVTLAVYAGASGAGLNFGYATDDSAAFNNALSACGSIASLSGVSHGGGRVLLGQKQYLVYGANISYPSGCDLGSGVLLSSQMVHGGTPPAQQHTSAIILNPAVTIDPLYGDALDGVAVFQWGLPQVSMTARVGVDALSNYSGVAITNNNDEATQVSHVVVGFETAYYNNQAQRSMLDHFWWDSTNGLFITHSHDPVIAEALEGWTFYQSNASWAEDNWTTTSAGNDGGGHIQLVAYNPAGRIKAGDLVRVESVTGYNGANNTWTVASSTENATASATASWTTASTAITVASCPAVTVGWPVYDVTKGKNVGTVASCASTTLTLQAASLSNGGNGDALSFGSTVVLANSQSTPSTTCTWASGALTMTCQSLNSLSVGQTMTLNGNANTVNAIDYQTNTVLLANKTTGTGSATSVAFANPSFVNDGKGTLNLSTAYRGGVGIYAADSQGIRIIGTSTFGYAVGWQADQVSTSDKLGQMTLADMTCDAHQEPETICGLVTEQNTSIHHGALKWTNGSVSIGPGQPLVADGGNSQTAPLFLNDLHVSGSETTAMIGSVLGGNLEINGAELSPGSSPAGQGLFNVAAAVSEVHLAGVQWSSGYLGFANPGQGNVFFSGDTSINAASPGAHIVQLFSGAGTYTWYKPGGLAFADVFACGGGGSGGSGAAIASGTASSGGGGGGGAGCSPMMRFAAADLGATETVTVGAGGASVAGVTGGVAGGAGNAGTNTYFGTHTCASGGGAGQGGASGANSGGGGGGAGTGYTGTGDCVAGNAGSAGSGGSSWFGQKGVTILANQGNGGSGAAGKDAISPGGGSGGGGDASAAAGSGGGNSMLACAGGGAGGGLAATPAALNGGGGGNSWASGNGASSAKGPSGGAGAGSSPTPGLAYVPASGASGGASVASGAGFAGGNGVQCGGGGGGGGSTISTGTSGASGKGGDGFLALWMTF